MTQAYLEKLFADADRRGLAAGEQLPLGQLPHPAHAAVAHRAGRTAVALLGDAAHTAHFSVGSGTKMAMEDAIALVRALDAAGPVPTRWTRRWPATRPPAIPR